MIIGLDGNEANVKNRVGSGQYAFSMLQEFSKVKRHTFEIYLKEKPLPDLPCESQNLRYKHFGPKKFWTQFALSLRLIFNKKLDIFFTLGHYGPRFSNVPYAVTIFDLSYLHFPQLFNKNDLFQLTNWSKYSINNSKHIFTISEFTKNDIIQNYRIDPAKITVTHMGYNEKDFKPQPKSKIDKIKSKYQTGDSYIIFVGTLQPRKNIVRLVEAFNLVTRDQNPETRGLKLVVVGKKGWLYDSIFEKVKDLELINRVMFTNFVPNADLPPLIAGAKAYILPSLWEGFGIPVIEAQACGVPVIVANTSSLPEVVGNSGITVNPADPKSIADGIRKVLTNNKLSAELVRKGHANVKRFSWQKCAQETLHQLEALSR